jgi:hypothetical protein
MTLDDLLPRLSGVRKRGRGWAAACPAHDDASRDTLSIALGDDGRKVLLHCWAGCEFRTITSALGFARPGLPVPHGRPLAPLAAARAMILREARHQRWARPGVRLEYVAADLLRAWRSAARALHEVATELGHPDDNCTWVIVALASEFERECFSLEGILDETNP